MNCDYFYAMTDYCRNTGNNYLYYSIPTTEMKAATISELKKELGFRSQKELVEICTRLVKYKKEIKELLTYLLFEEGQEEEYIRSVKVEMDTLFEEINTAHIYYAKKSLRKILRIANKYIRYSGSKQTEIELLIHFCRKMRNSGINISKSTTLANMYDRQLQKIRKALKGLHEDMQLDYANDILILEN